MSQLVFILLIVPHIVFGYCESASDPVCTCRQLAGTNPATDRAELQACLDTGKDVELQPGSHWMINGSLTFTWPLVLHHLPARHRVLRTKGNPVCFQKDTGLIFYSNCARIEAAPGTRMWNATGRGKGGVVEPSVGMLVVNQDVTLGAGATVENLIIDGNGQRRDAVWKEYMGEASPEVQMIGRNAGCRENRALGFNLHFNDCNGCVLQNSAILNSPCGAAVAFPGYSKGSKILNNFVTDNGHFGDIYSADGISVHVMDDGLIENNYVRNATDVGIIAGGGRNLIIRSNRVESSGQFVQAGLMLDDFAKPRWMKFGNFFGAKVYGNILYGWGKMLFGIGVGPKPWFTLTHETEEPKQTWIYGGEVYQNDIFDARIGINVDGAGSTHDPVGIYDNRYHLQLAPEMAYTPMRRWRFPGIYGCGGPGFPVQGVSDGQRLPFIGFNMHAEHSVVDDRNGRVGPGSAAAPGYTWQGHNTDCFRPWP